MMLTLALRALRHHLPFVALQAIGLGLAIGVLLLGIAIHRDTETSRVAGSGCADALFTVDSVSQTGDHSSIWTGSQARAIAHALATIPHARQYGVATRLQWDGHQRDASVALVSPDYFDVVCVRPKGLTAPGPDWNAGVITSTSLASEAMATDTLQIGRSIQRVAARVDGYVGTSSSLPVDVWLPWSTKGVADEDPEASTMPVTLVWVRADDYATRQAAVKRLATLLTTQRSLFPDVDYFALRVLNQRSAAAAERWKAGALAQAVVAGLLLLIVLSNLLNDRISRTAEDAKLLSTLHSLGTAPHRVLGFVLFEGLALYLLACLLGAALYLLLAPILQRQFAFHMFEPALLGPFLGVLLACLLILVVLGSLRSLLFDRKRLAPSNRAFRLLTPLLPWLIAAEITLLFSALALTALIGDNWIRLQPSPPRFPLDGLSMVTFVYQGEEREIALPELTLPSIESKLPDGWRTALAENELPFERYPGTSSVDLPTGAKLLVKYNRVSGNFFEVLGLSAPPGKAASVGEECALWINKPLTTALADSNGALPAVVRREKHVCTLVGTVDEGSNGRADILGERLNSPFAIQPSGLGPIIYQTLGDLKLDETAFVRLFVRHPDETTTGTVAQTVRRPVEQAFPGLRFSDAISGRMAFELPLANDRLLTLMSALFAGCLLLAAGAGIAAFTRSYFQLHKVEIALSAMAGATFRRASLLVLQRAALPLLVCTSIGLCLVGWLSIMLREQLLRGGGSGLPPVAAAAVLVAVMIGAIVTYQIHVIERQHSLKTLLEQS